MCLDVPKAIRGKDYEIKITPNPSHEIFLDPEFLKVKTDAFDDILDRCSYDTSSDILKIDGSMITSNIYIDVTADIGNYLVHFIDENNSYDEINDKDIDGSIKETRQTITPKEGKKCNKEILERQIKLTSLYNDTFTIEESENGYSLIITADKEYQTFTSNITVNLGTLEDE